MLTTAVIIACIAHIFRCIRWELFVKTYEQPQKRTLLQALAIGYFVNFFLPFKLGDLVRAWAAGKKMKNGRGFALATVIVDRYLDIIVVGGLFFIFSLIGIDSRDSVRFYIFLSVCLLLATVLVYFFRRYIKRMLKRLASVFKPQIEFRLLRFFWALIWSFKDVFTRINKTMLLTRTLGMWFLYVASYYCFAEFLSGIESDIRWTDIFYMLFAKNSIHTGSLGLASFYGGLAAVQMKWMGVYLAVPIIILFVLSFFIKKQEGTYAGDEEALNLIPHLDEKERLIFLEAYFSDERKDYIESYLKINQNIFILRDYSAGSNAATMLCMDASKYFFRKYAFGNDGDKLFEQVEWLKRFQTEIPLPPVIRFGRDHDFCYYDMPYDEGSAGLFEFAHSVPEERSWNVVRRVIECLENKLYTINLQKADRESIDEYISEKVDKNLQKIINSKYFKSLRGYENIIINGKTCKNIQFYAGYLGRERLYEIFKNDPCSEIHGDLTVENIICTKNNEGRDDFYMIDPNTGNIHNSPNLDYAKLLQSVHGGYEFLMAVRNVQIVENKINFMFTRSEVYTNLHKMLDAYMNDNFTQERIKSIYYHEIVHWLRLMPYKIEKNGKRALLFYAGMLMVMSDVAERFEKE